MLIYYKIKVLLLSLLKVLKHLKNLLALKLFDLNILTNQIMHKILQIILFLLIMLFLSKLMFILYMHPTLFSYDYLQNFLIYISHLLLMLIYSIKS